MSKEDVDRAIKDAEKFAEEDKKAREAVDVKNRADSIIFQSEKSLGEIGDKLSDADKADVQAALDKLKETVKTGDTEAIKNDTESLEKAFYALSEKLYKQSGAADAGFDPGAAQGEGASADGTYYNADYEDKTDSK